MKIDHDKVRDLQSMINYFLDGIREAAFMGGDIRDNIADQIDECRRRMNEWNAENIIIKEKDGVPDDGHHDFMKRAEKALYKKPDDLDQGDRRAIVMMKFYAFTKRVIKERGNMPGPGVDRHALFCYVDCIMAEADNFRDMEKQYSNSLLLVCDVIVTEITNDRAANPQLDIFTAPGSPTASPKKKTKK